MVQLIFDFILCHVILIPAWSCWWEKRLFFLTTELLITLDRWATSKSLVWCRRTCFVGVYTDEDATSSASCRFMVPNISKHAHFTVNLSHLQPHFLQWPELETTSLSRASSYLIALFIPLPWSCFILIVLSIFSSSIENLCFSNCRWL